MPPLLSSWQSQNREPMTKRVQPSMNEECNEAVAEPSLGSWEAVAVSTCVTGIAIGVHMHSALAFLTRFYYEHARVYW